MRALGSGHLLDLARALCEQLQHLAIDRIDPFARCGQVGWRARLTHRGPVTLAEGRLVRKLALHHWILISMLLGAGIGLPLNLLAARGALDPSWPRTAADIGSQLGTLFLRLLQMVVVPLIVSSLVTGVTGMGSIERLGKLGGRTFGFYITTSLAAIVTGLVMVNLLQPGAGSMLAPADGTVIAPHVVAVNHDHYFSFRLDLDVDGSTNSFVIDRLKSVTLPEDNPRRSVWVADETVAGTESEAQLTIDYNRPAVWRVTSDQRRNQVGYPTSYQLMPGSNGNTLLSADDYPRRRAGFVDHHLWVTPLASDEWYAAGDYPTLSEPGKGLPAWTAANRSIADTDIVLWYTIGMHHMVRAEDWPVMPVLWHWFELRPFDFFDGNPAMDLPEAP